MMHRMYADRVRSLVLICVVVRSDWHFLFDQPKWVLVPELEILQKLSKIYVEDNCTMSDITKVFPFSCSLR